MQLPKDICQLIESFCQLPGVGEKTAMRYVLAMLQWQPFQNKSLADRILQLQNLQKCQECGMVSDDPHCPICTSLQRQSDVLCVVENIADYWAIEKSNSFKGLYHILYGVLNPLMGIGPEQLTINKLLRRIEEREIKEVILALNPSVEGDVTCSYLKQSIASHVRVKRIALGIPMGGSLEYLDPLTINKALENRQIF